MSATPDPITRESLETYTELKDLVQTVASYNLDRLKHVLNRVRKARGAGIMDSEDYVDFVFLADGLQIKLIARYTDSDGDSVEHFVEVIPFSLVAGDQALEDYCEDLNHDRLTESRKKLDEQIKRTKSQLTELEIKRTRLR